MLNTSYREEGMAVQIRFARREERRVRSQVARILQMEGDDGSAHE